MPSGEAAAERRRGRPSDERPGRRLRRRAMADRRDPRPREVVLGVSGGIAAYKAVEVCRRLVEAGVLRRPGAHPRRPALRRRQPPSPRSPPSRSRRSLFEERSPIPHTRLGRSADLVVVAPATADFLARYAAGHGQRPVDGDPAAPPGPRCVVCPAMHTEMWEHPSVQREPRHPAPPWRVGGRRPSRAPWRRGDVGVGRLAEPGDHRRAVALAMLGRARRSGRPAGRS